MKKFIPVILLILASRLFLLSQYEDFFDATQYFNRFRDPNLLESLISGHPPFHPLYIFFGQLIYRFLAVFGLESMGLTGALISAIFGVGAIAIFYFLVKAISGSKKTALLTSIIVSLIPFVWVSQITTLIDSVNVFFTLLALLLFWLGLNTKSKPKPHSCQPVGLSNFGSSRVKKQLLIIGSGLSFGLALLAHTQAGFWIILFILLFIYYLTLDKPKDAQSGLGKIWGLGGFIVGPILIVWIYIKLMARAVLTNDSLGQDLANQLSTTKGALRFLLLDNAGDKTALTIESLKHNILGGLLQEITWIGLIVLIVGGYLLIKKKQKERWLLLLWVILPSFVFLYEYMNLHGRAFLLGLFAIAWIWSYVLREKKPIFRLLSFFLITQLVSASLLTIINYQSIPPNEKMSYVMTKLKPNGVMITSNGSRTWNKYPGKHLALGDQGAGKILTEINRFYTEQKPIFIHSNAIYHPTWIYDGHSWDIRANGPKNQNFESLFGNILSEYQLNIEYLSNNDKELIYTPSQDIPLKERVEKSLKLAKVAKINLAIINLIDKNTKQSIQRALVKIKSQDAYFNPERLDRYDAIKELIHFLKGKSHTNNWSLSDRDGSVSLPTSLDLDKIKIIISTSPTETRFKDTKLQGFVKQTNYQVPLDNCQTLNNLDSLASQSFVILSSEYTKQICAFDFEVEYSDFIEAKYLSGTTGKVEGSYRKGSKGDRAGFLSGGPYLTLKSSKYQVSFYLKTDDNSKDEVIGKIDVSKDAGAETLVSREIKATDFENPNQSQEFSLEFELDKIEKDIEFRTYFIGNANLTLEKIGISSLF